jgi:hypothetical protein
MTGMAGLAADCRQAGHTNITLVTIAGGFGFRLHAASRRNDPNVFVNENSKIPLPCAIPDHGRCAGEQPGPIGIFDERRICSCVH